MKKLLLLAVILALAASACAQNTAPTASRDVYTLEEKLLAAACIDTPNGKDCRIPYPYSEEFWGVCCGGSCMPRTSDCSKRGEPGGSLLDAMRTTPCKRRSTGQACEFSDELIKRFDLRGVCCNGKCLYGEKECYPLRDVVTSTTFQKSTSTEPKVVSVNTTGPIVGNIVPRADSPGIDVGIITKGDIIRGVDWFSLLLVGVVVVVCFAAAVLVVYFATRRPRGPVFDEESQIRSLLKEKRTIEEMIELAKAKYHKRTLDEDSFKEIVKENQKKLIEVETRISDLEARMKKLEKK